MSSFFYYGTWVCHAIPLLMLIPCETIRETSLSGPILFSFSFASRSTRFPLFQLPQPPSPSFLRNADPLFFFSNFLVPGERMLALLHVSGCVLVRGVPFSFGPIHPYYHYSGRALVGKDQVIFSSFFFFFTARTTRAGMSVLFCFVWYSPVFIQFAARNGNGRKCALIICRGKVGYVFWLQKREKREERNKSDLSPPPEYLHLHFVIFRVRLTIYYGTCVGGEHLVYPTSALSSQYLSLSLSLPLSLCHPLSCSLYNLLHPFLLVCVCNYKVQFDCHTAFGSTRLQPSLHCLFRTVHLTGDHSMRQ